MFGDCHIHMIMDGKNYKKAVMLHKPQICEADIRKKLQDYQTAGITFLRDGGDALGVSAMTARLSAEYGIDYRTPLFAIHKKGHYGSIVGNGWADFREYRELIRQVKTQGGHFIKLMFSGIMDFSKEGKLTEDPLSREEIRELIQIAHEDGFSVMAHVNGADAILAAVEAGVDSVEHGNFVDEEGICAMAEHHTIWVPTFVTIVNLIGSGRFDDGGLKRLKERQAALICQGFEKGVSIGLGSDAGAYMVDHVQGIRDEYQQMQELLKDAPHLLDSLEARLSAAEWEIRQRFQRQD